MNKTEKFIVETLEQKQVFDIYYLLGGSRSLEKLRQRLEDIPGYTGRIPALVTLKGWSRKHNWQLRIQQRDIEIDREVNKKTNEKVVDIKAKYRSIIRGLLSEQVKAIKEYQQKGRVVNIRDISDFKSVTQIVDSLIKLDMNLVGEIVDKTNLIVSREIIPDRDGDKDGHNPER